MEWGSREGGLTSFKIKLQYMARKRVKLQLIADNAARKATYKKRVKGLVKKVRELSILCGVEACIITYSRYHRDPEIWPSPTQAEQIVGAFRNRPQNDQTKKVLNQEIFTWQRILKARDELLKQQMKNRRKEVENMRTQCLGGALLLDGFDRRDLLDLMWAIDNQLEAVKRRITTVPRGARDDDDGDVPAAATAATMAAAGDQMVNNTNAAAKTSLDLAIDAIKNQLLQSEVDESLVGNGFGSSQVYEDFNFWLNPFIV